MNRSIQAEGSFAQLKHDMNFRRFMCRGQKNVLSESILLAVAQNINKLHNKIQTNRTGKHLFELNKTNPGHEGLNFGLLAAALFPGVALGIIYKYDAISYIVLVIISMLLSIYGIYYVKRLEQCGK
jgi:hypothetical protein